MKALLKKIGTFLWSIRNYIMIGTLVIALFFALKSYIAKRSEVKDLQNTVLNLNQTINVYKDAQGRTHAELLQVQVDKATAEAALQGKIDSLAKEINVKPKQIQSVITVGTQTTGTITSPLTPVVPTPTPGQITVPIAPQDSIYAVNYKDAWMDFNGKIAQGQLTATYKTRDSLNIVGYWKSKGFLGLGGKDYHLNIYSFNPNTVITSATNFSIKSPDNKRFGIGPSVAATWQDGKFKPVIGIGVQYNLIRF